MRRSREQDMLLEQATCQMINLSISILAEDNAGSRPPCQGETPSQNCVDRMSR